MKRRQAVLAALTIAPALVLSAACGSGSGSSAKASNADYGGKVSGTMNGWAFDNADDVGKARIAYANKQLSGASVKLDQTPFDAQKFTTRLAGGNVPDLVQMDRQFVATYAAQKLIVPLDKCFSDNKVDPQTAFYKSVIEDVTYQGKVWGVPQFYQPPAIMTNEKVMKAAGVTDAQIDTSKPDVLLAAIKKMYKTSGGVPATLGLDAQATGQANLWVLGLGGQLIDKDGKPTLDNPNNIYPLTFLKQISDAQGGYAKIKSFTDSFDFFGAKNQYVKDQVGAEVNAQWYPNVLSPYKDKIQLGAVPFRDKSGNPVTVAGGTAFVIPAKAKNPVAACKWALAVVALGSWKAAADARVATLKKNGGINTGLFTGSPEADKQIRAADVKSSGNAGFDQVIAEYYNVVTTGRSFGASPAGQAIQSNLINAITATLNGQKSAKQALADAQSQAMRAYASAVK